MLINFHSIHSGFAIPITYIIPEFNTFTPIFCQQALQKGKSILTRKLFYFNILF